MESLQGEVHVYRLDLAAPAALSYGQAWALLDGEEQARATRIRHELTRSAFVQVRAGLRLLLGRYLRRPPAGLAFTLGEKGKPRLLGSEADKGLVFNVSHSGECGLIALALDTALGVDVERVRPMSNQDGMAERCFAAPELAWWQALSADPQNAAFFVLWSCKEAFLKATGEGISLGLETCTVDASGPPRLASIPSRYGMANTWQLQAVDAGKDYAAALCYHGTERRLRLFNGLIPVSAL
jgi:4'-phosphopantetheinyl transferase